MLNAQAIWVLFSPALIGKPKTFLDPSHRFPPLSGAYYYFPSKNTGYLRNGVPDVFGFRCRIISEYAAIMEIKYSGYAISSA